MSKELTPKEEQEAVVQRLIDKYAIDEAKATNATASANVTRIMLERSQKKLEGMSNAKA